MYFFLESDTNSLNKPFFSKRIKKFDFLTKNISVCSVGKGEDKVFIVDKGVDKDVDYDVDKGADCRQ